MRKRGREDTRERERWKEVEKASGIEKDLWGGGGGESDRERGRRERKRKRGRQREMGVGDEREKNRQSDVLPQKQGMLYNYVRNCSVTTVVTVTALVATFSYQTQPVRCDYDCNMQDSAVFSDVGDESRNLNKCLRNRQ